MELRYYDFNPAQFEMRPYSKRVLNFGERACTLQLVHDVCVDGLTYFGKSTIYIKRKSHVNPLQNNSTPDLHWR